jgi:hypothetical protein
MYSQFSNGRSRGAVGDQIRVFLLLGRASLMFFEQGSL